ncbi:hypothetical protein B0T20DRAFT_500526 [Sordaria brevicollis]|uniref:Uncharacterized protein n=1 Tax=Sordaria brevicollis TaxID=83679 RepID=A0AAE0PBY5_SORBR|nr:hypothetical protein B0T20DRAFT_500526 [Sordaria brevicollis]
MLSLRNSTTLWMVFLWLMGTLFPIAVQAKCAKSTWNAPRYPLRIPSGLPQDIYVLQPVNLSDFAAELKAAGWNKLHVGFDPIIHDKGQGVAAALSEEPAYADPEHHQGMPEMNKMWCVGKREGRITFRRKDAVAQMGRFCGRNSPLWGKVLKGPITVQLKIPTLLQDNGYKNELPNHFADNWYWLEWSLYVQEGCEWVHDENQCLKYLHAPLDACRCGDENDKMGGAVMNKCYMFGLWIRPTFYSLNRCFHHDSEGYCDQHDWHPKELPPGCHWDEKAMIRMSCNGG